MDPVTHSLAGAVLGNAFFKRRLGAAAVPAAALGAVLPDIDSLVLLTGSPAAVALRRTFGHSLFALPFLALVLALVLKRFFPRERGAALFWTCLAGAGSHVALDLLNVSGVYLLWPYSDWRPVLAVLFSIDFALIALLAAPFILCLPSWAGLERGCRLAGAAAAVYLFFCAGSRTIAQLKLADLPEARGADFSCVFPEPYGSHRWRGVLRRDDRYQVFLIDHLSGTRLREEHESLLNDPTVAAARRATAARELEKFFTAPVWFPRGSEARVYDLRYRPLVTDRGVLVEWIFPIGPDGAVGPLTWGGRSRRG